MIVWRRKRKSTRAVVAFIWPAEPVIPLLSFLGEYPWFHMEEGVFGGSVVWRERMMDFAQCQWLRGCRLGGDRHAYGCLAVTHAHKLSLYFFVLSFFSLLFPHIHILNATISAQHRQAPDFEMSV